MDCKHCSQKIPGYDKRQSYCSKACYSASRTKIREPKCCKQCGNLFQINRNNCRNVFCSESCFHTFNTREMIELICEECKALFYVKPGEAHRKHCSRKCMYIKVARFNSETREKPSGIKNGRYLNGITCYREIALNSLPNFCNRCKKTGCKFEVHHIDENRQNNVIENLEVLCLSCHRIHHKSKSSGNP